MRAICVPNASPRMQRAVKASLLALALAGGGGAWQHIASERIAARAEQARLASLQMTPRKLQALAREAEIAAAAQAYAARHEAEQQMRTRRATEEAARANTVPHASLRKG